MSAENKPANEIIRCEWVPLNHPLYIKYHDEEWGVPVYDDRLLLEFLILEGAQAGLSWSTILNKRENYRQAFDHFDAEKMAGYGEKKIAELLEDKRDKTSNKNIVRNRLKIASAIKNARAYLKIIEEHGSFSSYIWKFVGHQPQKNQFKSIKEIPARTTVSDTMSKELEKRGFSFVGSTICYAFMQAVGMVNDHIVDCFRYEECDRRG